GPTFAGDRTLTLELAEHAPGHLLARADEAGQMRPGQHGALTEEEVTMASEDAQHAPSGLLVEEAINALPDLVERGRHRVDCREPQGDIRLDQAPNLASVPLGTRAIGRGHESQARQHRPDAGVAEEDSLRHDA